jgi:hypothetical protein
MNKYLPWIIILLLLTVILFGVDVSSQYREIEIKLQTEKFNNEQRCNELEKEIRVLKQDIYLLQNGFESGGNK